MHVRRALALALLLALLFATQRAHAWQEAHQVGDDARVAIDRSGAASVEHVLRWHVVRGPLKSIDLVNVDTHAVIESNVTIAADDGRTTTGHAVRRDDGTVRITADDRRALLRGNFGVSLRWHVDLVASGAISRDGAAWRLSLSAPVALEGFDGARTVIDLPSAPDEPRPIAADTGAVDDGAVAALHRGERDVLELVRPHVARGESATWTVRIDPRALPLAVDPRLRSAGEASPPVEADRVREASLAVALGALALAFGLLVAHKGRVVARACAAHKTRIRGLLPLPEGIRATLAGMALSAAAGMQMADETTAAAGFIALAILATALRAPKLPAAARGPGQWVAVRPERAFSPDPIKGHWLDLSSPQGRATALAGIVLVAAAVMLARRFDAKAAWLAALDAAPFVPLFVTGRATQLPPHGVQSARSWLVRAFRQLCRVAGLRVVPWARVAPDGAVADELRLLVLPAMAMPGVVGVEIGLAWSSTPVSWAATPEVLARVLEGSPAAIKLAHELPRHRGMPGRRAEERVIRLLPRRPTRSSTIALVRRLAEVLTDRRDPSPVGRWTALERRAHDVSAML